MDCYSILLHTLSNGMTETKRCCEKCKAIGHPSKIGTPWCGKLGDCPCHTSVGEPSLQGKIEEKLKCLATSDGSDYDKGVRDAAKAILALVEGEAAQKYRDGYNDCSKLCEKLVTPTPTPPPTEESKPLTVWPKGVGFTAEMYAPGAIRAVTTPPTEWEERFDELMRNLPVNDYRVLHTDLITNEPRLTARGTVIKDFITQALAEQKARMVEVVEGMKTHEFEHPDYGSVDGFIFKDDIIKALSK